ncbi:MAG: prephenate dehydrogenase/arogenate dehydrogenase family protein, partial [Spirochaetia bacterium]
AVEPVARELAPHMRPGTVVVDTCSVKLYPVDVMRRHLPEEVGILATHPMFGPDSAKNGIEGLPLIYWPERSVARDEHGAQGGGEEPGGVDWWPEWFASVGLRTIRMSPDEHDHEAAYTQGITHFIGRVLDDLSVRPSPIGTVGYQKILDVVEQTCNDPLQLFLDLQRYNPYTTEMRAKLKASLERVLAQFDEQ